MPQASEIDSAFAAIGQDASIRVLARFARSSGNMDGPVRFDPAAEVAQACGEVDAC